MTPCAPFLYFLPLPLRLPLSLPLLLPFCCAPALLQPASPSLPVGLARRCPSRKSPRPLPLPARPRCRLPDTWEWSPRAICELSASRRGTSLGPGGALLRLRPRFRGRPLSALGLAPPESDPAGCPPVRPEPSDPSGCRLERGTTRGTGTWPLEARSLLTRPTDTPLEKAINATGCGDGPANGPPRPNP